MRNFSLPFPSIFASGNVCLALCQAPCGLEPTLWRMGYPNGFFKWQNSHSLAYKVCFPIYTWECRSSWASLIQLVSHEIFSLSLSFSLVFSVPSTTVIPQVWVGVPLLLEFLAIQIACFLPFRLLVGEAKLETLSWVIPPSPGHSTPHSGERKYGSSF